MKKWLHFALAASMFLSTCSLAACQNTDNGSGPRGNVLRIASWDEYIDEGGEDSYYSSSARAMYEEFADWYNDKYDENITVEYVTLQDNETMYNKIKMGDTYDLLCPSEYMIMKLAAEGLIKKLPATMMDASNPDNHYIRNLSPYIRDVFESGTLTDGSKWSDYTAGYMWGTTGFVFNPDQIGSSPDEARTLMQSWTALSSPACERKITSKDNVRDAYFTGLGMYYETELLALKNRLESGEITLAQYKATLAEKMNDTSVETMNGVKKKLEVARGNLYGLETDEGKTDMITGRLAASYQWSGDAVFILDEAEDSETPLYLEYSIPQSASNLWFDRWVMMNGANEKAATAFINYVSMPENVVRNMYYIGYTSCMASEEVFDYVVESYGADDEETDVVEYDLSYFFGAEHSLITTSDQLRRQLFAQYPDQDTINRLVVMGYFDKATNERANRMWNNIK